MTEPTPRIIGAEWAVKYPDHFGTRTPRAASEGQRIPCDVCGHPTGDCTHDGGNTMPPTTRNRSGGDKAPKADRDPTTGVPTASAPSQPPADPTPPADTTGSVDPTDTTPLPADTTGSSDSDDGDATPPPADGGTPGAAADGAPVPAVDAQGGPQGDLRPMGATGAANSDNDLAGGMHEASEALDAEIAEGIDEVTIRRRAFTDAGNGLVTATRRVLVSFIPAGTYRRSKVLLFAKGQTFSRAQVAHRLAMYDDRADAKIEYQD